LAEFLLKDRYEKRHKNLAAHLSPAFRVELGDVVTVGTFALAFDLDAHCKPSIGQCRPLSKTVRFNVLRVTKNKASAKAFGKF
jgi:small subunit ribosomal protein S11e